MRRRHFIIGSILLFVLGAWVLELRLTDLIPNQGGRALAAEFFSAALQPALTFQDPDTAVLRGSFLAKVAGTLGITIRYAVAAISLAIVLGFIGGILGSRAWWNRPSRFLHFIRLTSRFISTALRSVHELIWALLFLTAFGTSPLAAVFALAIPYAGNLAKVFSELFDEADKSAAEVLSSSGASGLASFLGGIATRAFPDLASYTLYRLECAIRSSAVLGFVGIPTLGYEISTAFEDGHYHEIWTYIYGLIAVSLLFEAWSGAVQRLITRGSLTRQNATITDSVQSLWKKRSRSRLLSFTLWFGLLSIALSWGVQDQWGSQLTWDQRQQNLTRFLSEMIPHPVQKTGDWSALWPWLGHHLSENGIGAVWQTLHLATAAILLAGAGAILGVFFASRTLSNTTARGIRMTPEGNVSLPAFRQWRQALAHLVRLAATISRSLPEFILAFLLLQMLGPTIWALIIALTIHNLGILIRLGAEVLDNTDHSAEHVMLTQGSTRTTAYLAGLIPTTFNRWILFLMYRWESCIREATVLGILSVGSLGFLISEARVRFFYDEMLLWIILGATLVLTVDLSSDKIRRKLAD